MERDAFLRELAAAEVFRMAPFALGAALPDNTLLIGPAPEGTVPPSALVLDRKGAKVASTTRLVWDLPEATLAAWPLWQCRPGPRDALAALTVVAADAAPDALWATVVLLARLAGCSLDGNRDAWLPSIERWEREGMVDDPWTEWPSLASALSHAHYTAGGTVSERDYATAWAKGLRFAAECLLRGEGPSGLHAGLGWPLLDEAVAGLEQEQQTFHDWLSHAQVVQLSVPLASGNRRRVLVDALLFAEDQPTGAAKVLYRSDAQSPLGRGYALSAHHRPGASPGSGFEYTISLDPRRGLTLHDLWKELEQRENAAWAAAGVRRPSWAPRPDMDTALNQPWYLDPTGTIIGTPRAVEDKRVSPPVLLPGTRLDWAEVQDAIWAAYNPLRNVRVTTPLAPTTPGPLLSAPAKQNTADGKRLVLARWHSGGARALGPAPIVERTLAALIVHPPAQPITLRDLPQPGAWTRVELSGGFAVASQHGLFVLDDWRPTMLNLPAIEDAFSAAVHLDEELARIEAGAARPLAQRLRAELRGGRTLSEPRGLVVDAARAGVLLAGLRAGAAGLPADADARTVREALDRLWGLDRRLLALEQQVRTVRESVTALGDARVRRIGQAVALMGFPYYVGSGMAAPLSRLLAARGWIASFTGEPPPAPWWACFTIVTLGMFGLLLAWQARGGWRPSDPDVLPAGSAWRNPP